MSSSAFTCVPQSVHGTAKLLPTPLKTNLLPFWESDDHHPLEKDACRRRKNRPNEFVGGDRLHTLRRRVLGLRTDLQRAHQEGDTHRAGELKRTILAAQQQDAEFVYTLSLDRMKSARSVGRMQEAEKLRKEANLARQALPQFNLEGLWVGKYGQNGYEMINVTYSGDTLIAYKVTGGGSVPKGEVTFTVELSPDVEPEKLLEPVELDECGSQQWGVKYLSRFTGQGQIANPGFQDAQFVEGQLILVNQYMSFAFLPLHSQVFFGRPSPELTLKLLREAQEPTSEVDRMRAKLTRSMEMTETLMEEEDENGYKVLRENYYDMEGCFE